VQQGQRIETNRVVRAVEDPRLVGPRGADLDRALVASGDRVGAHAIASTRLRSSASLTPGRRGSKISTDGRRAASWRAIASTAGCAGPSPLPRPGGAAKAQ